MILNATIGTLLLAASSVGAQGFNAAQQYADLIRSQSNVNALDSGLTGESVDNFTGRTDFVATDVSLPGMSGLPVAVGRRYSVANHADATPTSGAFGDWDIEIPHIEGVIATSVGWPGYNCSNFSAPPAATVTNGSVTTTVPSSEYSNGFSVIVPGTGRHEMLYSSATVVTSGFSVGPPPVVTKDWWVMSCAPLGAPSPAPQQGFKVTSPAGVTYSFLKYSTRPYAAYVRPADTSTAGVTAVVDRQLVWMLPTTITDRFGNSVSFQYTTVGTEQRLTNITSSDGRTITLIYTNGAVTSVSDGTRTWSYTYASGSLTKVTLPDSTTWGINFGATLNRAGWTYTNASCTSLPTPTYGTGLPGGKVTATITHPTGTSATFTFTVTRHGRYGTAGTCLTNSVGLPFAAVQPAVYDVLSLTSKVIKGANLPTTAPLTWTTVYTGCTPSSCNATKATRITDARGYDTLYTFGAQYNANPDLDNEGLLLSVQSGGKNNSGYLRTDSYTYFPASGQSYPSVIGTSAQPRGDVAQLTTIRPLKSHTTTVDGATYQLTINTRDQYGYATSTTSTGTNTKSETVTYKHDTTAWVLGTLVTKGTNGTTEESNTLDSKDMPIATYQFGRLVKTFTYYANGTVNTVSDGASHATTFSNYKLGVPQTILHPDGGTESAIVDSLGRVTQWTDAQSYKTNYAYDVMGRLKQVIYPGSQNGLGVNIDNIAWTTASTGWTRTLTHGSYTETDKYDGFLRPIETDEPGSRVIKRTFDPDGNTTFSSYPGSTLGITSAYDGLGRLTTQTDGDNYVTTNAYNANALTVQDRNGHSTTYNFMTYDQPSAALADEDYYTTIRDDCHEGCLG